MTVSILEIPGHSSCSIAAYVPEWKALFPTDGGGIPFGETIITSREHLFDQEVNIRIGVRYVEQLLAQFSGNVVQAIAAYNAGPVVVGTWATTYRGRSEDEFVELIQYQETRQYVKRVLRSYKEYLRLFGAPKTVS